MNDLLWSRLEQLLRYGSPAQQSASLSCLCRMKDYRAENLLYAGYKDAEDPAWKFRLLEALLGHKHYRPLKTEIETLSRTPGPYQDTCARMLRVYFSPK